MKDINVEYFIQHGPFVISELGLWTSVGQAKLFKTQKQAETFIKTITYQLITKPCPIEILPCKVLVR